MLTLIFAAVLGGIILNIMPCVFPVLSLKVLKLIEQANNSYSRVVAHGLMYTIGIMLSFAVLAAILIALKGAGLAIGWGFQMQSPLVVTMLIFLLFLVGLNFLGLFDINSNVNFSQPSGDSLTSSFMTGVLATLVATPCSAPFMATAIGVALTLSNVEAIIIFLALGFGLALPLLLLCIIPTLLRFMPRPGAWMVTVKQFLAFPMFLSVVWLYWVLLQQVTIDFAMLVLLGLVLVPFVIWLYQKQTNRLIFLVIIGTIVGGGYYLTSALSFDTKVNSVANSKTISDKAQIFSKEKLNKLVDQKKPVFVYATAAWCLTCKMNEKIALNNDVVLQAFKANNTSVLIADWTNYDPKITEFLESFGRNGVPFYVYYPPNQEPVILPQFLTPKTVIAILGQEELLGRYQGNDEKP